MIELLLNEQFSYMVVHFIFLSFFIIMSEWKKDFIYFFVTVAFSVEMGIYLLSISEIHIIISLIFFVLAGYFMVLAMGYIPFLKPYTDAFREHFGLNDD